jgi:hypothetical protein
LKVLIYLNEEKKKNFCIRRNKLIMIRELMRPNEMIRAFLSALSSGRLSWYGCFNNSFQIGSCISPGKSANLKLFCCNFRWATFKADIVMEEWILWIINGCFLNFRRCQFFQSGVCSAKNNPLLAFQICGELHKNETPLMQ